MMTPVTMVSREPTQQSDDYITGKVSKKTSTTAPIATLVNAQDCWSEIRSQALQARNATNGLHRNGPYR